MRIELVDDYYATPYYLSFGLIHVTKMQTYSLSGIWNTFWHSNRLELCYVLMYNLSFKT